MSIRLTRVVADFEWYVGDTWKLTRRVHFDLWFPLVVLARTVR